MEMKSGKVLFHILLESIKVVDCSMFPIKLVYYYIYIKNNQIKQKNNQGKQKTKSTNVATN